MEEVGGRYYWFYSIAVHFRNAVTLATGIAVGEREVEQEVEVTGGNRL